MTSSREQARRRLEDVLVAVVAGSVDLLIYLTRGPDSGLRFGGQLPEPVAVGVVLLGAVALLARRRHPVGVFALAWATVLLSFPAPDLQPLAVLLVALYTVAVRRPLRTAVPVAGLAALALVVQAVSTQSPGPHRAAGAAFSIVVLLLLAALAWSFGRYRNLSLRAARHARRDKAEAVREERLRLARELHDIISHTVSVMTLQAAGARTQVGKHDDRVVQCLEVVERAGVQAMNELHRLLGILRADGLDEEPFQVQPQLADLPALVELARAAGQDVRLELDGSPGALDPSVELACYRLVQESLTNARRHAGHDAPVRVGLSWRPPTLVVTVANERRARAVDGPDQPVWSSGHGLAGLAERVQLVGGRLEWGPVDGGGYLVRGVLPATAERTAGQATGPAARSAGPGAAGGAFPT